MAQIKLRIEMNHGRTGAPMDKLAAISRQLDKFLRALAADLSIPVKKGEWLAVNFANGSVKWDAALQTDVSDSSFRRFNETIDFVADFDPETEGSNRLVSDATLLEYGRIGLELDPDEIVSLGLYATAASKKPKKWRRVGYRETAKIRVAIERPLEGFGSVQGFFHSWIIGGPDPHFQLRELSTDALVRCSYDSNKYDAVAHALQDKRAIVIVSGPAKWDRAKRQLEELEVEKIYQHKPFEEGELDQFFGVAPSITGRRTTSEYFEIVRGDG